MGLTVGDYVQLRDTDVRGEVVKIDCDGWCMVYETHPKLRRLGIDRDFFFEHEKHLVRLLRKEQADSLL